METSDEELVSSYKKGDEDSFKILIERYVTPVYNFARRQGVLNDAADVTQDIFLKVWKNIKKFDEDKASFKTWLFTIARHTIIDWLRKQDKGGKKEIINFSTLVKNEEDSWLENIEEEQPLPIEMLQKLEDVELLKNILDKLPLEEKIILSLHYEEDMTFSEISEILGKPLNTVKSQHGRILQKLKDILK